MNRTVHVGWLGGVGEKSKRSSNTEGEYMKNKKTNQRKNKIKLLANGLLSNFCRMNRLCFIDFRFLIDYRFAIFSIILQLWLSRKLIWLFLFWNVRVKRRSSFPNFDCPFATARQCRWNQKWSRNIDKATANAWTNKKTNQHLKYYERSKKWLAIDFASKFSFLKMWFSKDRSLEFFLNRFKFSYDVFLILIDFFETYGCHDFFSSSKTKSPIFISLHLLSPLPAARTLKNFWIRLFLTFVVWKICW